MTAAPLPVPTVTVPARASKIQDGSASALVVAALRHVAQAAGTVVARAPGRLDIMGGNADSSGSLALSVPTSERVCVAVEPGSDDKLRLVLTEAGHEGVPEEVVIDARGLWDAKGGAVDPAAALLGDESASAPLRCVFGVIHELLQRGLAVLPAEGVRIVLATAAGGSRGTGALAAGAAGALAALGRAWGFELEAAPAALLCQEVLTQRLGLPAGRRSLTARWRGRRIR